MSGVQNSNEQDRQVMMDAHLPAVLMIGRDQVQDLINRFAKVGKQTDEKTQLFFENAYESMTLYQMPAQIMKNIFWTIKMMMTWTGWRIKLIT